MLDALNETPQEMYVDGDTLSLIVTGSKTTLNSDAEEDTYAADTENYTKLYTYDISDRSQPQLTGVVQQQGHYSTSRKTAISFICLRSLIRRSAMHRKLMSTFRQSMVQEWSPRIFSSGVSEQYFLPGNLFCEHRKTGCDHRSESSCICSGEFLCK